ncbi:MAG TPA: GGDEF domain-containing protein, partial [Spirochaetia bacterium]|nr:GGDEF domain-containing protein [Spirochaetia bacterium]
MMSTDDRAPRDIYERLRAQGTPEEEIEVVYRKLREAGYGEEAARRRLEASLKRLQEERARADRRNRSESTPTVTSPRADDRRTQAVRPSDKRRMEDWFPKVPVRLRRQINKWAYQNRLQITGLRERWLDLVSIFKSSTPDLVNPQLLASIAKRKHYLAESPYGYSLATTLDALYTVSRTFLAHSSGRRESERGVADALRRREPFAYEYLSRFSHFDETLRGSLAYLELAHDKGTSITVPELARVTRETYRLVLATERVSRQKVDHIFSVARDVLLAYGGFDGHGLGLDDAQAIFGIALDNLQRFKTELYPVALRAIGAFYDPADESAAKMDRLFEFADLTPEDILTVKGFYQQEARRKERMLAEQQMLELEAVERTKAAGFANQFGGVLSILEALFPDSGIAEMETHAYLVPYFDERVFVHALTFDHGAYNVEAVSRYDPLQPILVLHRIVDNLLSSVDHVRLERILGRAGLAESIAQIKAEWAAVYATLFSPYLRALNEYARGLNDDDTGQFTRSVAARRLEEEINQLRNRAIHRYGHSVAHTPPESATRLWSLVERLTLLLETLGEEIHQDIGRRTDPVSKRIYDALGEEPIVDFQEYGTPGSLNFKPVVRQLRRYIEAKYRSSLASVPRVAQLFLIDMLRGTAELYRFLTNEETSFVRSAGARVLVAGDDEAEEWKRERNSRAGDMNDRLRIRLDEHLLSEYTDTLTGMKTKNFFLQRLPAAFDKIAKAGKPLAVMMIDIDHFKWVNDELGHQKGDEVLRDAATTVLDG